tara:strand:+ start:213 stop:563 length:351 start_codon:yes stop_codon:yes gene_type:complete
MPIAFSNQHSNFIQIHCFMDIYFNRAINLSVFGNIEARVICVGGLLLKTLPRTQFEPGIAKVKHAKILFPCFTTWLSKSITLLCFGQALAYFSYCILELFFGTDHPAKLILFDQLT